ncbi:UPF0262 family protein [Amaricoccus solimangrovi]|uniref:UPF0262 protein FJM51_10575 n=1 Tax=Amaricoccus solimangrovi TaxID=2589815 RepID=A0A501WQT0_9RHOB|nr:UPF0262 family protein [Amaricoccus solimangrovi]TPE50695.1 UPF0262 family protein [Amaricoccus solimangrovi]
MTGAGEKKPAARLVDVTLDESGLAPPTPEIEQERRVAIYDLLEENRFGLLPREGRPAPDGPYRLTLSIRDRRLVFALATEDGTPAGEFHLSLTPFNQVVKDYFQICESYFDAVKHLPPAQIEAIDMGRRGIHNEGSRVLLERLEGKVETDMATARRLFTLICVLHFKG